MYFSRVHISLNKYQEDILKGHICISSNVYEGEGMGLGIENGKKNKVYLDLSINIFITLPIACYDTYRNMVDFCVLTLYPEILLNSLIDISILL